MNCKPKRNRNNDDRNDNRNDLRFQLAKQFRVGNVSIRRSGRRILRREARRNRGSTGGICGVDCLLLCLQRASGLFAGLNDLTVRADHWNAAGFFQLGIVGRHAIGRYGNPDGEGEGGVVGVGHAIDVFFAQQLTAAAPQRFHRSTGGRDAFRQSLLAIGKIVMRFGSRERHFRNASSRCQRIRQREHILLKNLQQRNIGD